MAGFAPAVFAGAAIALRPTEPGRPGGDRRRACGHRLAGGERGPLDMTTRRDPVSQAAGADPGAASRAPPVRLGAGAERSTTSGPGS